MDRLEPPALRAPEEEEESGGEEEGGGCVPLARLGGAASESLESDALVGAPPLKGRGPDEARAKSRACAAGRAEEFMLCRATPNGVTTALTLRRGARSSLLALALALPRRAAAASPPELPLPLPLPLGLPSAQAQSVPRQLSGQDSVTAFAAARVLLLLAARREARGGETRVLLVPVLVLGDEAEEMRDMGWTARTPRVAKVRNCGGSAGRWRAEASGGRRAKRRREREIEGRVGTSA
jgi:hypothetical protein